jgi:hypothetical protein
MGDTGGFRSIAGPTVAKGRQMKDVMLMLVPCAV